MCMLHNTTRTLSALPSHLPAGIFGAKGLRADVLSSFTVKALQPIVWTRLAQACECACMRGDVRQGSQHLSRSRHAHRSWHRPAAHQLSIQHKLLSCLPCCSVPAQASCWSGWASWSPCWLCSRSRWLPSGGQMACLGCALSSSRQQQAPGRATQPQQHGALCSWRWMHVTNVCDCPARTLQGLAVEAALPPGAAGKPVVSGGALPKWLGWHVVGICLRQSRAPCLPGMPCILCLLLSQHASPPATDGAGPWAVGGDLYRPVWSL